MKSVFSTWVHRAAPSAAPDATLRRGAVRVAKLALASAALTFIALSVQPTYAEAYDNTRGPNAVAYVSCEGSNPRGYYCNSIKDMFNCTEDMLSGTNNPYQVDTVTIELLCDWNTKDYGHLVFNDSGSTYFIKLHGHMIDRGLTTADTKFYGTGNGDVIRIKGETKVIIDGGTEEELKTEHYGKLVDDGSGGKFWKYDANADKNDKNTLAITGGLITGGADDDSGYGGGISIGSDDAGLGMTNVTVAGNVTDNYGAATAQGTGTRYGAGIHARGGVNLKDCKVIYNHSESSGGGISCSEGGESSFTVLDNTEVCYNTALNDGGGLWNNASNSSIMLQNECTVSHNISARYGGGMYIYTRGTGTLGLGANTQICDNVSLGVDNEGGGGGICFHQDMTEASGLTVIVEDGVNISRNSAQGHLGGGVLFDMPMHSSSHFIVKGTWTVSENKAASGGGIAQRTDLTQNFDFGNIVLTNNETTGSGGGIYKKGGGTDTFGSGAVLKGNKAGKNGGFLCADYGKGTVVFPDGGLTIEDNTAGYNGGAIAAGSSGYLTLSCSTGGMKFINNRAGKNGGAIYASRREDSDPDATPCYSGAKLDMFGDTTTEFANNTASERGGALMLSCETDRTSHISNATFTGNTAGTDKTEGYGGAIFFRNELYLKNVSITGNSATKAGGGIYCYNTEYYNFEFAGKMTVFGNNKVTYAANGTTAVNGASNLEMHGKQEVCSAGTAEDAVTSDSKIGVTISDYSSGNRRITGNAAFVTQRVGDSWKSCVVSDNSTKYRVVRDGDYLYLAQGSTESELEVYGVDESAPVSTDKYKVGTEVELKSSDYPKTSTSGGQTYNWVLDYWTVSCDADGTSKIVKSDANGVATITMGSDVTVARAHYTAPLTYLLLGVTDSDAWDNLTSKTGDAAAAAAYTHYAQFDDAEGKRSVFTFDADETPFTVTGRTVADNVDTDGSGYVVSKSITYTLSMPVSVATEKGLVVDKDALKKFGLQTVFSGMDDSTASGSGELSVNNDGTVTFSCTVTKTNPTKKVCTVTFDVNGGELPAGAEATLGVTADEKLGTLPVPTKENHTFEGWFIKDKDVKVTEDTAVISNLTLVAKWSENEKSAEYVTVTCKDGDTDLGSYQVEKGSSLSDPVHPTKTGYTFKGWKRKAGEAECVTFPLENVAEDITLYADWTIDSYKVTFDLAGGELDGKTSVDSKTVNYGDKLANPGTPTKDGFEFVGWYNGADAYDFSKSVTSGLSLIAVWKEKAVSTFEVSFNLNGADGDAPAIQQVTEGGYAATPDDPTWEGHVFKGWYTDRECSDDNKFNFATTTINAETKLYAKWAKTYTVTFVFNNGTDEKETRVVEEGTKVSDLPRVTYADYIFTGWFDTDKNEFKEGTKLTSDLTLQAYWDHEALHVRFWDDECEIEDYSKKVIYGAPVKKPDDPKKTGYTFEGWYSDAALTEPYRFNGQAITADTDIYAKWTANTYTLTFDTGKGSKIDAQSVPYGTFADAPASDPTREGYDFTGWYKDKDCTEEFNFNATLIDGDVTVYAGWKVWTFTVTFDTGEGSKVDPQEVAYGSCVKEPAAPTHKGYTFEGWTLNGKAYDFKTPVTGELPTLVALWKEKKSDTSDGDKKDDKKDDTKGDSTSDDTKGNADTSDGSSATVVTETKTTTASGRAELAGTGDYAMVIFGVVLVVGIAAVIAGVIAQRRK